MKASVDINFDFGPGSTDLTYCWNGPSGPGLNDLVACGLGRSGVDPAVKTKTSLILILDFTIFNYEKVGVLSAVRPL